MWNKVDLHIHTAWSSDATARVEDVLDYAANKTDLRVIAITDHDTIAGALEARQLSRAYGIEVIVGEEVSTHEGHLLALFIEHLLPPGRPAAETIAAVHAQGGLCFAAHPYGWMVPSLGWEGLTERATGIDCDWPLDGLEAMNASLWLPANNARAQAAAQELGMAVCGGSDSHHLSTIGSGYTLFPGTTADDLRQALQHHQTFVGGNSWGWFRTSEYLSIKLKKLLEQVTDQALRPSTQ